MLFYLITRRQAFHVKSPNPDESLSVIDTGDVIVGLRGRSGGERRKEVRKPIKLLSGQSGRDDSERGGGGGGGPLILSQCHLPPFTACDHHGFIRSYI